MPYPPPPEKPLIRNVAWRMNEEEYHRLLMFFSTFESKSAGMRWLLTQEGVAKLIDARTRWMTPF